MMSSPRAIALAVALACASPCLAAPAARPASPPNPADTTVASQVIATATLSATVYSQDDGKHHPALLILGGAEGGRDWADNVARQFARQGYTAMAETYFNGPGLPDQLKLIPIERFGAAIDWLAAQPGVDKQRIGVVGISKGAEAALVFAAHDPRVHAVVAASPSDVVWQDVDRQGGAPASSWTWHGEPLAYVPFKACPDCKGLLDLYRSSRDAATADPAARIAVEKIHGPLLLISSTADQIWPSSAMAHAIDQQLQGAHFAYKVTEAEYPDGGHFAFGIPPIAATAKGDTDWGGGNPEKLAQIRADCWKRTIGFLDGAFASRH